VKLTLRFFASVREALGMPADTVELPDTVATVGEVRAALVARGGAWASALGETRNLRMACNQAMCKPDAPVREGDEVAFFPPVTGG
jgi:sulfur-carrier protein